MDYSEIFAACTEMFVAVIHNFHCVCGLMSTLANSKKKGSF